MSRYMICGAALAAMVAVSAPAKAAPVLDVAAAARTFEQGALLTPVYYHHRWRRHYGYNPAAAAFAALAFGMVGSAIANSADDDCAWGGCDYGYVAPSYGGYYYGGGGRGWRGGRGHVWAGGGHWGGHALAARGAGLRRRIR